MKPPRDNSKLIETTVEKPERQLAAPKGSTATVAVLGPAQQIITDIRSDHALFERHSKMAAFLALRIGLRLVWVKNNDGYGSLTAFIKEHLSDLSNRTVYNYIRIADAFVSDSNLRDKKTTTTSRTTRRAERPTYFPFAAPETLHGPRRRSWTSTASSSWSG